MGVGETSSGTTRKKAKAGLLMMNGLSQKKALTQVGYAPSTAKAPKRNGIDADQCIAAMAEVYPHVMPADLLASTRELFKRKLDALNRDSTKVKLGEISRALEVVERYHGERTPDHTHARDAGERLAYLATVLQAYKDSGGDIEQLARGLKPVDRADKSHVGKD